MYFPCEIVVRYILPLFYLGMLMFAGGTEMLRVTLK